MISLKATSISDANRRHQQFTLTNYAYLAPRIISLTQLTDHHCKHMREQHRCTPVQALSLQTLQRVVSVTHSDALRPHLATLIASLVEGLSALEPQALQYMQFHAEKQYGVSGDQMERLRLSAARGGPLQVL
jgi:hypothetical protein